jgi:putative membrane protein
MALVWRAMPLTHRLAPPPPQQVTVDIADRAGFELETPQQQLAATSTAHFGYGAAGGALYGVASDFLPGSTICKGVGFGLAVWTGSYLGWLDAIGSAAAADHQTGRRNQMMIAAHVVWGAALGVLFEGLAKKGGANVSKLSWRPEMADQRPGSARTGL